MNASPVTHAGSDRPDRKKSSESEMARRAMNPMPSTNAKYSAIMR